MKALIIGFGKMGMLHAATLNALGAATELIICDSSAIVREGLKAFKPEQRIYEDYRKVIEHEAIDLAVVAAPNHAHCSIVCDLLKRGIHTFVEKPFVADFREAKEAYRLFKDSPDRNVKLMVGYCLRFVPTYSLAKKVISEQTLGKLFHFNASMYSADVTEAQGGWRFEKGKKGGGVLLDLGSHLIDLVRFLFGLPGRISATTERWVSKDVEDFFNARFFYPGFHGVLEASWSMPNIRKPTPDIFVLGENGTLKVTNDEVNLFLHSRKNNMPSGLQKIDATQLSRPVPFDLAGPFYTEQWLEFLGAIQKESPYRNGVLESLANHELVDLVRDSAGRTVTVAGGTVG